MRWTEPKLNPMWGFMAKDLQDTLRRTPTLQEAERDKIMEGLRVNHVCDEDRKRLRIEIWIENEGVVLWRGWVGQSLHCDEIKYEDLLRMLPEKKVEAEMDSEPTVVGWRGHWGCGRECEFQDLYLAGDGRCTIMMMGRARDDDASESTTQSRQYQPPCQGNRNGTRCVGDESLAQDEEL